MFWRPFFKDCIDYNVNLLIDGEKKLSINCQTQARNGDQSLFRFVENIAGFE